MKRALAIALVIAGCGKSAAKKAPSECALETACTKVAAPAPPDDGLDHARIAALPGVLWIQKAAAGRGVVRLEHGTAVTVTPVSDRSVSIGAQLADGRLVAIATDEAPSARVAILGADGAGATFVGGTYSLVRRVVAGEGWIAFDATPLPTEAGADHENQLYRVDLAGGTTTALTHDAGGNFMPVRLDAKTLVFASSRDGDSEIYKLPVAGGAATRLTAFHKDDWSPVPAPDGQRLAFVSDREGLPRIFVLAADGTTLARLTKRAAADGEESSPAWSPDGARIAYVVAHAGASEVWLHDVATGAEQRVTTAGQRDTDPVWSPDGAWLAVRRFGARESDVLVYPLPAGSELLLTRDPGDDALALWTR